MTAPVATYSFLPWLRQGLSGKVVSADLDPSVKLRARIPLGLDLAAVGLDGAPITVAVDRNVDLYGPGDVIGIERRAIVRTEPVTDPVVTNFEANYLPAIEFYDEDFPWRYTPAAPNQHRLRPWITLVVLADGEFEEGRDITEKPLPFVTVADRAVFPKASQLAAWAHVHVNRSLAASATELVSTDMTAVLPKLESTLREDRDLACSRILCPRKLSPNTGYTGFLIPVFESGRLAGLGLDPAKAPFATHGAWDDYPTGAGTRDAPASYPFYYSWRFRTAAIGDFEYLVRLLQAKPVDKRVGTRDIDAQSPSPLVPGITGPALDGVLKLGGALRVPRASLSTADQAAVARDEGWATPYPQPFQSALAAVINLNDAYETQTPTAANAAAVAAIAAVLPDPADAPPADPDPMITPPLYGRWHALTNRLLNGANGTALPNRTNWIHELNLDPRFRAAAGVGTQIIQKDQENYMNVAWTQIGDVLAAIQRMRAAELAKQVSKRWHERYLVSVHIENVERAFAITAPMQTRVVAQDLTVQYQVSQSPISSAATSVAMRRMLRPTGRIIKRVRFGGAARAENLLARMNSGVVAAAPPKEVPSGANTIGEVVDATLRRSPPVVGLLRRFAWLPIAVLLLGALIALFLFLLIPAPVGPVLAALVFAIAVVVFRWLRGFRKRIDRANWLSEDAQFPEFVATLPVAPTFVIEVPRGTPMGPAPATGTGDSVEARRFKEALVGAYTLLENTAEVSVEEPRHPIDIQLLANATITAIDPLTTILARTFAGIDIPAHIAAEQVEEFKEPLFYPEINTPMYKPLYELSAELFIPNVNLIPENSITLLETNQKFIESYMVGLNVEFGRELLWREYPSDNRGSYFRQFWDVSAFLSGSNANDPALRERLKDIPPIHRWSRTSRLGAHDNRADRTAAQNAAVLVIRGELLKRYPRAVIYAQRADWVRNGSAIDTSVARTLVDLTEAEASSANPPRLKLRTPLYAAKVEPDIYFLGFDLTVDEVVGGTGENANDDPGWFFVLKERPGEPRFGLDESRTGSPTTWSDIAWTDVLPTGAPAGSFIDFSVVPPPLTEPSAVDVPLHNQWADDNAISWSPTASSADLAYVLFRPPVLVAIHAAELLQRA